jgi:hypothetical protein
LARDRGTPVHGLPVPVVQLRLVQEVGDDGVLGVPGQRVVEPGARGDLAHELLAEGDRGAQLELLVADLVAHPLKLQPREVPELRHVGLLQIILDAGVLHDLEAVLDHAPDVFLRHGNLVGGDEVNLDLLEDLETVHLGVYRAAVEEVPHKGQVDGAPVPVQLFQERELVQELLSWVLVTAIPRIEE